MIDRGTFNSFKQWYKKYSRSFFNGNKEQEDAVKIKITHTYRVCTEAHNIARSINLGENDMQLAESIALFHDIGRFEQFRRHGTFSDHNSEDHGALSAEVLQSQDVLMTLSAETKEIIYTAVRGHNKPTLGTDLSGPKLVQAKIIRDADKLDIYHFAINHFKSPVKGRNKTVEVGMSHEKKISPAVLEEFHAQRIVSYSNVKTLYDFQLLQMSWMFDLNFSYSYKKVLQKGYLEELFQLLPQTDSIQKIYTKAVQYAQNRYTTLQRDGL